MDGLNRWYNRRFPPHSVERLVFLLVISIPIGLLVGVVRDALGMSGFSWGHWLGLTFLGWVIITLGWFLSRHGSYTHAVLVEQELTRSAAQPSPDGSMPDEEPANPGNGSEPR